LKNSTLCDHNSPTSQTDGWTDGQTDRQTTCDRITARCTLVQSAVLRSHAENVNVTVKDGNKSWTS